MNRPTIKKRALLALAVGAAALTAWLWLRDAQPSTQDAQNMKTYTENMTTHCVGRFLIDAPSNAETGDGSYGFQIAKIQPIQKSTQSVDDRLRRLDRELAERVAAQATWKNLYGDPLEPAQSFVPRPDIRSIWYGKPDSDDKESHLLDGFVLRQGGTFVFEGSAYDAEDVTAFNAFLIDIAPTLSVRENSTVPTQRGFCFDNGFIAMNPKRGESTGWGWDLPGHPSVSFGLGTTANGDKVEPGLLDREGDILKELKAAVGVAGMANIKTLRKRRHTINGMVGQEWLREITDDKPEYQFDLEIPGKPNDLANPNIRLSLRVGGYGKDGHVKPSLTTGEALALWDAVIQTLRLRPGAV